MHPQRHPLILWCCGCSHSIIHSYFIQELLKGTTRAPTPSSTHIPDKGSTDNDRRTTPVVNGWSGAGLCPWAHIQHKGPWTSIGTQAESCPWSGMSIYTTSERNCHHPGNRGTGIIRQHVATQSLHQLARKNTNLDNVFVRKMAQEFDFAEGSLRINNVIKSTSYLFDSNLLIALEVSSRTVESKA